MKRPRDGIVTTTEPFFERTLNEQRHPYNQPPNQSPQ